MWLLSFSFSRLLLLLCNAGGILEFKTREKILPKSSQHSIDQGIDNNDLKLIFWKKKHFVKGCVWVLHTMSFGNGRSPRRSFRKFSSCAQRSASADQSSSPPATATKSVVNSSSSSTPPLVSAKKRLSLKHKLPELSGSLTRVAKNVGSGLSSLASTLTTDQNTDQPTAAANTESNSSSSSSVLGQLSRENSFKMWLQRNNEAL